MNFNTLQHIIGNLEDGFRLEAGKSVNRHMTVRNWLMGFYIVEFEQNGEDRAKYGEMIVKNLASSLNRAGLSTTNLKIFRQFFLTYTRINISVINFLKEKQIGQTSDQLQLIENQTLRIGQTSAKSYESDPEMLISRLSFSQITLIMQFDEPLQRAFYEIESIKGGWSVRELKRQIDSALFERTGLSTDKAGMLERIHKNADLLKPEDFIRSPFMFEFLGVSTSALIDENDLENKLLDHLQLFLLELGRGFCFEARQKRMLIGKEWHKVDLVFYHRLLKCHVLIDLKTKPFKLSHAGQMNGYVNFYRENEQQSDDNPPIGILLCNAKDETVVKYALGGLDEQIFVSQYKLHLPDEETFKSFLEQEKGSFSSKNKKK
jgi:predicted nuclease of restriction endonuclease-like (RecB) superfamily